MHGRKKRKKNEKVSDQRNFKDTRKQLTTTRNFDDFKSVTILTL